MLLVMPSRSRSDVRRAQPAVLALSRTDSLTGDLMCVALIRHEPFLQQSFECKLPMSSKLGKVLHATGSRYGGRRVNSHAYSDDTSGWWLESAMVLELANSAVDFFVR